MVSERAYHPLNHLSPPMFIMKRLDSRPGPTFFQLGASLPTEQTLIFREVEDRDLIAKARQGDVEAYNLLVSRWEKRIFNYLLRLVSNREDALDLSQETFLKAYQNLRKLDDPARFSAWLFRIAHNEAFSLLRRRKPESELSEPRPRDFGGRLFPIELLLAGWSVRKNVKD